MPQLPHANPDDSKCADIVRRVTAEGYAAGLAAAREAVAGVPVPNLYPNGTTFEQGRAAALAAIAALTPRETS